jgi:hypothetical protein
VFALRMISWATPRQSQALFLTDAAKRTYSLSSIRVRQNRSSFWNTRDMAPNVQSNKRRGSYVFVKRDKGFADSDSASRNEGYGIKRVFERWKLFPRDQSFGSIPTTDCERLQFCGSDSDCSV